MMFQVPSFWFCGKVAVATHLRPIKRLSLELTFSTDFQITQELTLYSFISSQSDLGSNFKGLCFVTF